MNVFVLQTLFLLLLAFFVGWLIGRLIKSLICPAAPTSTRADDASRYAHSATAAATVAGGAEIARRSLKSDDDAEASSDVAFQRGGASEASAPESSGSDTIEIESPGASALAASKREGATAETSSEIDADIGDIQADNLQIIEGIGPKMESILHENGIATWSELASHSESDLRGILDQYGDKYRIINPESWIAQARLAAEGKADELIAYQKKDGVSKLENMINAGQKGGFGKYRRDDLKIVEGIGPKIEKLLKDAGIDTWKKLSEADVGDLQKILDAAGPSFRLADPKSWPVQAELADSGQWAKLKEYQDALQGGRAG
ncbi:MAG TPA: hypothetical protein ENK26_00960 [Gammaproteobacteria bacterium]|nr:hypothetical protein [Gammaproteobacteria bacterium]